MIPNYLRKRRLLLSFEVKYEFEIHVYSIKSLGFGRAVAYLSQLTVTMYSDPNEIVRALKTGVAPIVIFLGLPYDT